MPASRRKSGRLCSQTRNARGSICTGVRWETGRFKKVAATHRARQAYRVALPARSQGAVEYYLEAMLADGQKLRWPATAPVYQPDRRCLVSLRRVQPELAGRK